MVIENKNLSEITVGEFLEIINGIQAKVFDLKDKPQSDRITIDEVSAITGHGLSMLYKLTMEKKIPHRKFGKRLIFSRKEIFQWMESQTVKQIDPRERAAQALAASVRRKTRRA